jgi:hypothetical protein
MAIYTPRGLKLRLPINVAFTYIARLHPHYTAFEVLKTTEGIQIIPDIFGFIIGVILFFSGKDSESILIYTGIATLIGGLIRTYGIFILPILVKLTTIISYMHGYFIFTAILVIVGYITVGINGLMYYFVGRYGASIILFIIDLIQCNYIKINIEHKISSPERNFLYAYRILAIKCGATQSLNLEQGELESDKWKLPYFILDSNWSTVTKRFDEKI